MNTVKYICILSVIDIFKSMSRNYSITVPELERAFSHFLAGRPYRLLRIIKSQEGLELFADPCESFSSWCYWQFFRAVSAGDSRQINLLVKIGLHKFAKAYETNENALILAARHDMVEGALFDGSIDLESTDYLGRTALLVAARHGASGAVGFLLRKGVKHAACSEGNTAMHFAAMGTDWVRAFKTVEVLLNAGVNSEAKNRAGATPLDVAVNSRRDEMVRGLRALLSAAASGKPVVVEDSDRKLGDDIRVPHLDAAWTKLRNGDPAPFSELIRLAGPSPSSTDFAFRDRMTPVPAWAAVQYALAAKTRDMPLLEMLNRHGLADWARCYITGHNALHCVAKEDWAEGVKAVNAAARSGLAWQGGFVGDTPLHAAVQASAVAAVRQLLALNVDANMMDPHGRTPLHVLGDVSSFAKRDICDLLMAAGAHLGEVSDGGQAVSPEIFAYALRHLRVRE